MEQGEGFGDKIRDFFRKKSKVTSNVEPQTPVNDQGEKWDPNKTMGKDAFLGREGETEKWRERNPGPTSTPSVRNVDDPTLIMPNMVPPSESKPSDEK